MRRERFREGNWVVLGYRVLVGLLIFRLDFFFFKGFSLLFFIIIILKYIIILNTVNFLLLFVFLKLVSFNSVYFVCMYF